MSRWLIGAGLLTVSLSHVGWASPTEAPCARWVMPALRGATQQSNEKQREVVKPAAHVALHDELLQEQQTLQRLQTEWLLQLLKTKQRLDKTGTETAKHEAAVCAKLLESARELPALYETATMRLKDASLTNLPATEKTLKATKRLADELQRACRVLEEAPKDAYGAERAVDADMAGFLFAMVETADWSTAFRSLDRIEQANDPAPITELRELLNTRLKMYGQISAAHNPIFYHPDGVEAIRANFRGANVHDVFAQVESSLALVDKSSSPKGADAEAAKKLRIDLRNLQVAFDSYRDANGRLMVVVGLRQLADRQQRLHDRLQKQRDEVLSRLLGEIE